ncbi:MAG: hypothetical protein AAF633_24645 [Chloroflexota bacterium]
MVEQHITYAARWYNRAGIWIGIGINPASITLGGGLASHLDLNNLIWLIPIGVLALAGISMTAGIIGRRRRETFAKWSSATFGMGIGAILINLMMALGMSGWSGFQVGLGGTGLSNLIFLPGFIGIILMAVIIFSLGSIGINRWNWFVWLTTLSSLALAAIALVIVWQAEPIQLDTEPLTFSRGFWVVGSIISFASLFSLRSTDFTWDLASDWDVVFDALAFLCVFSISISIGVMLYRTTGAWDLAAILDGTNVAFLGQLFLFLSLLSPALSTMHSGALAWEHVLPVNYRWGTIFIISTGLVLGLLRFDQQLLSFLDWLGAILPPAIAVLITTALMKEKPSTNWVMGAWIGGAVVALIFKLNDQLIHLLAGSLVSLIVIYFGQRNQKQPTQQSSTD